MRSNRIEGRQDREPSASQMSISGVYGDLTFEQAAQALERCGIAFSTEIIELPGPCIIFVQPAIGFHFEMRWRGFVRIAHSWEHPDLGLGIELEQELPPEADDWLDENYREEFRLLPRTALIFANELHRARFAEEIATS